MTIPRLPATMRTLDGLATTRNSVEAQVNALRTYVITGNANLLADYRSAGSDITVIWPVSMDWPTAASRFCSV